MCIQPATWYVLLPRIYFLHWQHYSNGNNVLNPKTCFVLIYDIVRHSRLISNKIDKISVLTKTKLANWMTHFIIRRSIYKIIYKKVKKKIVYKWLVYKKMVTLDIKPLHTLIKAIWSSLYRDTFHVIYLTYFSKTRKGYTHVWYCRKL